MPTRNISPGNLFVDGPLPLKSGVDGVLFWLKCQSSDLYMQDGLQSFRLWRTIDQFKAVISVMVSSMIYHSFKMEHGWSSSKGRTWHHLPMSAAFFSAWFSLDKKSTSSFLGSKFATEARPAALMHDYKKGKEFSASSQILPWWNCAGCLIDLPSSSHPMNAEIRVFLVGGWQRLRMTAFDSRCLLSSVW